MEGNILKRNNLKNILAFGILLNFICWGFPSHTLAQCTVQERIDLGKIGYTKSEVDHICNSQNKSAEDIDNSSSTRKQCESKCEANYIPKFENCERENDQHYENEMNKCENESDKCSETAEKKSHLRDLECEKEFERPLYICAAQCEK